MVREHLEATLVMMEEHRDYLVRTSARTLAEQERQAALRKEQQAREEAVVSGRQMCGELVCVDA